MLARDRVVKRRSRQEIGGIIPSQVRDNGQGRHMESCIGVLLAPFKGLADVWGNRHSPEGEVGAETRTLQDLKGIIECDRCIS
jgi:hypothetical protein